MLAGDYVCDNKDSKVWRLFRDIVFQLLLATAPYIENNSDGEDYVILGY